MSMLARSYACILYEFYNSTIYSFSLYTKNNAFEMQSLYLMNNKQSSTTMFNKVAIINVLLNKHNSS